MYPPLNENESHCRDKIEIDHNPRQIPIFPRPNTQCQSSIQEDLLDKKANCIWPEMFLKKPFEIYKQSLAGSTLFVSIPALAKSLRTPVYQLKFETWRCN
mmetsp:Transcript_18089/g.28833  ORF Transcript_18089/g.28833 Transcript_18089/m.28833 type:complete len:100 (+) Transcript_18089:276-575(+)